MTEILKLAGTRASSVTIELTSSNAPVVNFASAGLTVNGEFIVKIIVTNLLLQLNVKASADGFVSISGSHISGRLNSADAVATITQNNLGFPLSNSDLNRIIKILIPFFLPLINQDLSRGLALPIVQGVSFYSCESRLVSNHIQAGCMVRV